jgi:hypothetical protein
MCIQELIGRCIGAASRRMYDVSFWRLHGMGFDSIR